MALLPPASIFYYKIKTITREMEVEWRDIIFRECKQTMAWRDIIFRECKQTMAWRDIIFRECKQTMDRRKDHATCQLSGLL